MAGLSLQHPWAFAFGLLGIYYPFAKQDPQAHDSRRTHIYIHLLNSVLVICTLQIAIIVFSATSYRS